MTGLQEALLVFGIAILSFVGGICVGLGVPSFGTKVPPMPKLPDFDDKE